MLYCSMAAQCRETSTEIDMARCNSALVILILVPLRAYFEVLIVPNQLRDAVFWFDSSR